MVCGSVYFLPFFMHTVLLHPSLSFVEKYYDCCLTELYKIFYTSQKWTLLSSFSYYDYNDSVSVVD